MWRLEERDGILLARCAALDAIPGLVHAFSTRVAHGGAGFDLGPAEDATEDTLARRWAFMRAAGFGASPPMILRQVHGAAIVTAALAARPPEADGAISATRGLDDPVPAVRTADCIPLLLADRLGRASAAVHAGWRGIGAGIGTAAVDRFAGRGVKSRELVAALGPAILGCCYEVGEEVVAALAATCGTASFVTKSRAGRSSVDLHAALRGQLTAAGIPGEAIHGAPWCTRCRNDLFFSARAEGAGTGRLMAAIGRGPDP